VKTSLTCGFTHAPLARVGCLLAAVIDADRIKTSIGHVNCTDSA
jgi:hypothetical protein